MINFRYCPYCGVELASREGRFCQSCGKELVTPAQPDQPPGAESSTPPEATARTSSPPIGEPAGGEEEIARVLAASPQIKAPWKSGVALGRPGRLSPWFWIGCLLATSAFASWLLPALAGTKVVGTPGVSFIIVIAFMARYLWKRGGSPGWQGWLLGFIAAWLFLWTAAIAISSAHRSGWLGSAPASSDPLNLFDKDDLGFVPLSPQK